MSIASVQAAIAAGSWLGGRVLDAGFGLTAVFTAGSLLTCAGGVIAWWEWRGERRAAVPHLHASATPAPATPGGRTAAHSTDSQGV